jgi:F420-non-reducing hydrogenase iron-sulfur subunit
MCSGRVDLEFIFKAFLNGQDGVFIGGCRLGECNYVTHGNYDALSNVYMGRKLLAKIGINPERLRIEFMSGADGNLLAEKTDDFSKQVKSLGPLGESEGLDVNQLRFKLESVRRLVPYIKLVERERLRAPAKSKEVYDQFFNSDDVNRLFDELISQITALLKDKPLTTGEIAQSLGLNPSDVSRHMKSSSRRGLVRYDVSRNCYMTA